MKKTVLLILSIVVLASCGGGDKKVDNNTSEVDLETHDKSGFKMAYYHQDSVVKYFDYFREQDSLVQSKQIAFQNEMERQQKEFQAYILQQEKRRQSGMLSENQIIQVQQSIQTKEANLMNFQQQQGAKIEEEAFVIMNAISNKVKGYSEEFCKDNNIDILFVYADGAQIKYISPDMDVTESFTDYLNKSEESLQNDIAE